MLHRNRPAGVIITSCIALTTAADRHWHRAAATIAMPAKVCMRVAAPVAPALFPPFKSAERRCPGSGAEIPVVIADRLRGLEGFQELIFFTAISLIPVQVRPSIYHSPRLCYSTLETRCGVTSINTNRRRGCHPPTPAEGSCGGGSEVIRHRIP